MAASSSNRPKRSKSKGFAKAFKLDIGGEKEAVEEKWAIEPGRSLLMNPVRQKIFKYLCQYPCSSLSTIARDFNISPASMSWHLKLLVQRGLISETKLGGQKIFFPLNILDQKTIPVLFLLAKPKINLIFNKIIESPGLSQKELAVDLEFSHQSINTFTNRLQEQDLITIIKDGKFTRYYPSKLLSELELSQRKKFKEFRKWVIQALKQDGVNPKLIRVTDRELFLQITAGKKTQSLKLPVNPFFSIIQDKKQFFADF